MMDLTSDTDDNVPNAVSCESSGNDSTSIQRVSSSKSRQKLGRAGSRSWFNKSFDQTFFQQPSKPVQPRTIRRQKSVTDFFQNVLSKSKSHLQDIFTPKKQKSKPKSLVLYETGMRAETSDLKVINTDINGGLDEWRKNVNPGLNPELRHSDLHNSCPSFWKNENTLHNPIILKHHGSLNKEFKARIREKRRFTDICTPQTDLTPTMNTFIVTGPETVQDNFEDPRVDNTNPHVPIVKKNSMQFSFLNYDTSNLQIQSSNSSSLVYPITGKIIHSPKLSSIKRLSPKIAMLSPLSSSHSEQDGNLIIRKVSSAPHSTESVCSSTDMNDVRETAYRTKRALVKSNSDTTTKLEMSPRALVKASSDGNCFNVNIASSLASSMISLGNIMNSITEYLFLGSVEAAYNEPLLCKYNISSLIDMTNLNPTLVPPNKKTDCPCACASKTHFRSKLNIGVDDIEWENLEQYFEDINSFIHGARKKGRRVLIFSYMGQSRAPAAVIQHIMHYFKVSFKTALNIVKTKRPQTKLNSGFVKLLLRLEKRLQLQGIDTEVGYMESKTPEEQEIIPLAPVETLNALSCPPVVRGAWLEC